MSARPRAVLGATVLTIAATAACMMAPPPGAVSSTASSPSDDPAAVSSSGRGWIPFDGEVAGEEATVTVLRSRDGRELRVSTSDVRVTGLRIELRVGGRSAPRPHALPGIASSAPPPPVTLDSDGGAARGPASAGCVTDDECGGCSACVGLVRMCCDGGGIVGACWGVQDCP